MENTIKRIAFLGCLMALSVSNTVLGQNTEKLFLSGTGSDNTVDWEFFCTEGQNSGRWTRIPVPSNWELQGFGIYNYGHARDAERGKESGLYRHRFDVPGTWKGRQVEIVFEGSMTDTKVLINGKTAGPVHQGSFYRFSYDISGLLEYGKSNLLEVRVDKHSANESVNRAERFADFWIFGGIFRPVWLEVKPEENIKRVAINARADGTFMAQVFLSNHKKADKLVLSLTSPDGKPVGENHASMLVKGNDSFIIMTSFHNIRTWNPEQPHLYRARFDLYRKGKVIHQHTESFGFRTVEVRKRDGIYVNGVKIKIKGVNRHTFWPTSGRASSKARSIEDVLTIKSMNMNGVRMAHYPPDAHFLDVCDSLGLFVLNELAGWHDAYDTKAGSKLVEEMIKRDVNHPSIILWDNGNEGGHNYELLPLYRQFDIQQREVIHPWLSFNGISTEHYRGYDYGMGTFWHGREITLPTEFLHGMHDGGQGSGLYDFWEQIWKTPVAAGGFIWDFADQGVVRTDKDGILDTYNSKGADGILGPWHEKEGSYHAIREIWSPVHFEERNLTSEFDGKLYLENRFLYTNLEECLFNWKLLDLPTPGREERSREARGTAEAPDLAPRQRGHLILDLPGDWQSYDVLCLTVTDPHGRELYTWSWPVSSPLQVVNEMKAEREHTGKLGISESDSLILVNAGKLQFRIGKNDGLLKKVSNEKGEIPFNNGPVLSAGLTVFKSIEASSYEDSLILSCTFEEESRMKEFKWTFYPSGWMKLDIAYLPEEYDVPFDYMGVNFSYPEYLVRGVKWMGHGPYRVWKNRMQGVELSIHQKDYNTTMTGIPPLVYPEFKGYHSNLYWAEIESREQSFILATTSEDVFLRLFTPDLPENEDRRLAPPFPSGDISFMQGIPAMGSKTNDSWNLGPSGRKNVYFDFGPYDHWRLRCKRMSLFFNFSPKKEVVLVCAEEVHPRIEFGKNRLSDALENAGYKVILSSSLESSPEGQVIVLAQEEEEQLAEEGFSLVSGENVITISGAGETGTLYGCMELANRVDDEGKLPASISFSDEPEMVLRGSCIGLQKTEYLTGRHVYEYPYTPENFPWFYDREHWVEYLDMMLENRYNSLYLWNGHPFASLVKLEDYPYAVEVDEETFELNREIFAFITEEANKRGIWVIQMFYNIIVSKPFAEHHGLKTQERSRPIIPVIADYTRKSVAAFIENYPNVGLMVCLGEAMHSTEDDVEWFTGTIIPGVKDGLAALGIEEEPPIVLRGHDTDPEKVMQAALPIYRNLYTTAKYNGESLTTYEPRDSWASIHQGLSSLGSVHISNVHILANLEPFRYGSPDFIRKSTLAMHDIQGANGLHLYPQASYWDWPYTADKAEPRLKQIDRDWIWYKAWGRYAWNSRRNRSEEMEYWSEQLGTYYGNEKGGRDILEAYEQTGEIAPKLLRRFGISDGNRQTLLLGMFMSQLVNPYKWHVYSNFYTSNGPEGEILVDYARKEWKGEAHSGELPVQIIEETVEHGQLAVEAIERAAPHVKANIEEFERLRNDVRCYDAFARFFKEKVNAAQWVLRYKYSREISDLEKAVPKLEKSLEYWEELVGYTGESYLYANSMQTQQRRIPITGRDRSNITWSEMLPHYRNELENFKRNLNTLKTEGSSGKQAKVLQPVEVRILNEHAGSYPLVPGQKAYVDREYEMVEVAEELKQLKGVKFEDQKQQDEGTLLRFENDRPVKVLVGYFNTNSYTVLRPPTLETNAMANERGQADIKIANALRFDGLYPVNIYTYRYEAGENELRLGKGRVLILGFIDAETMIEVHDAGISAKKDGIPVDWLFY